MRMARLPHLAILSFAAAVQILLVSICPSVSGRIYRTKDAIVIEVDGADMTARGLDGDQPRSTPFANRNFGSQHAPIPMTSAFNPYPNFPFWPFYKPASRSNIPNVENVAATSSESRRQTIACGVGPDSPPQRNAERIVGGTDAKPNSWPFVVGLRIDGGDVACGGSIISRTRILTAAHCVNELSQFEISAMTVSLGMHTQGGFPNTNNDAQQTRRVTRVVYHKEYNADTNFNDIAVLTIDPPINYSKDISPVCLTSAGTAVDQFVKKDAAIMGWGTLRTGGPQPNILQQATVQVISNEECQSQYGADSIRDQQLCASAPKKDSCQGDSGGPLVVQAEDGSTTWTQVGVVSYGKGCAKPGFAGVYASVAFFRKWINSYVAQ